MFSHFRTGAPLTVALYRYYCGTVHCSPVVFRNEYNAVHSMHLTLSSHNAFSLSSLFLISISAHPLTFHPITLLPSRLLSLPNPLTMSPYNLLTHHHLTLSRSNPSAITSSRPLTPPPPSHSSEINHASLYSLTNIL
jgi:hypothetical protein